MQTDPTKLLRDASLWSVEMLEAMSLSLFFQKDAKLDDAAARDQVAALIWVHHVDVKEDDVELAVELNTWPECVKSFKRNPRSLEAMVEVPALMERVKAITAKMPVAAADADGN